MGKRFKDANWTVSTNSNGDVQHTDAAILCTLMDLRDELKALNRVFGCVNFQEIPTVLRSIERSSYNNATFARIISRNTTKKRKKRTVAK